MEKKLERTMEQNKFILSKQQQSNATQFQQHGNQLGIQTGEHHNLTDDNRGEYSDFNTNHVQSSGGFATTTGMDNRIKGVKVQNENGNRKINQRSQSVLKSHTEFNHNFGNQQATSGSIGSSTTQRANINNQLKLAPNSKST